VQFIKTQRMAEIGLINRQIVILNARKSILTNLSPSVSGAVPSMPGGGVGDEVDAESKEDEPGEAESKEDEPKEDESKEDAPKEDEPKEDAPKEDETGEAESREAESKEDSPKEDEPKEDAPKEDETGDAESKEDVTGEATSDATSNATIPNEGAPVVGSTLEETVPVQIDDDIKSLNLDILGDERKDIENQLQSYKNTFEQNINNIPVEIIKLEEKIRKAESARDSLSASGSAPEEERPTSDSKPDITIVGGSSPASIPPSNDSEEANKIDTNYKKQIIYPVRPLRDLELDDIDLPFRDLLDLGMIKSFIQPGKKRDIGSLVTVFRLLVSDGLKEIPYKEQVNEEQNKKIKEENYRRKYKRLQIILYLDEEAFGFILNANDELRSIPVIMKGIISRLNGLFKQDFDKLEYKQVFEDQFELPNNISDGVLETLIQSRDFGKGFAPGVNVELDTTNLRDKDVEITIVNEPWHSSKWAETWEDVGNKILKYYLMNVRQGFWINHSIRFIMRTVMYTADKVWIQSMYEKKPNDQNVNVMQKTEMTITDPNMKIELNKTWDTLTDAIKPITELLPLRDPNASDDQKIKEAEYETQKIKDVRAKIFDKEETLDKRYLSQYKIEDSIWLKLLASFNHLGHPNAESKEFISNEKVSSCTSMLLALSTRKDKQAGVETTLDFANLITLITNQPCKSKSDDTISTPSAPTGPATTTTSVTNPVTNSVTNPVSNTTTGIPSQPGGMRTEYNKKEIKYRNLSITQTTSKSMIGGKQKKINYKV